MCVRLCVLNNQRDDDGCRLLLRLTHKRTRSLLLGLTFDHEPELVVVDVDVIRVNKYLLLLLDDCYLKPIAKARRRPLLPRRRKRLFVSKLEESALMTELFSPMTPGGEGVEPLAFALKLSDAVLHTK